MSKFRKCDTCQEEISKKASACPKCGHDYRDALKNQSDWTGFGREIFVIAIITLAVIIASMLGYFDDFIKNIPSR